MLAVLLVACGNYPSVEAPTTCGFPPGTRLAWAGESSLHRLGLGHPEALDERGMIYVTADRLMLYGEPPLARRWCLVPPPGSSFASQDGVVPDHWTAPLMP